MAKKIAKKYHQSKIISIRQLCKLAGIDYFTIYRRKIAAYKSDLDDNTKTKVANALIKDIAPFLEDLGYDVRITPVK